ncbi:MAG: hypothetical protein HKN28_16720 [Alphaproteobacteria bacterium]|nr:hypothetical protein [Alphaproteobacteria bacterium]
MKITVDIDCTPEEARQLMGLPDVSDMQQEVVDEIRKRLLAGLDAMDPQAMLQGWNPAGTEGWEQIQKMFWSGLAAAGQDNKDKKE